mmetsp:Transcript_109455/g.200563  ORF Transcript_109455/g.200563 Transcript_109455/m.200563 type:complete len:331 (+) Transcript_109455:51-1043(+)
MWLLCLLVLISLAVTSQANSGTSASCPQDEPSLDGFTGVSLLQSSLEVVSGAAHAVENKTLLHQSSLEAVSGAAHVVENKTLLGHAPEGDVPELEDEFHHEEDSVEHYLEGKLHEAESNPFLYGFCLVIPLVFATFICRKECCPKGEESALEDAVPRKAVRKHSVLMGNLHREVDHGTKWQESLGKFLEGPLVTSLVIILVLVDLCCTVVNDLLEETDLLNPKYHEQGEHVAHTCHNIIITVLILFMCEHICALVAFGHEVFYHSLFVLDVVVVWITYVADVVLGDVVGDIVGWLIVLRLWKLVALAVDIAELMEKASGHASDAHGHHGH